MKNISRSEWAGQCLGMIRDKYKTTLDEVHAAEEKIGYYFREDHKKFLLNFGGGRLGKNRTDFLKHTNYDYDLDTVVDYYSDLDVSSTDYPPSGWDFFAFSFFNAHLAINQLSGEIYNFDSREIYDFFADSVDKFVLQSLVDYYLFFSPSNKVIYTGINRLPQADLMSLFQEEGFTIQTDFVDRRRVFASNGPINIWTDFNPVDFSDELKRHWGKMTVAGTPWRVLEVRRKAKFFAKAIGLNNRV